MQWNADNMYNWRIYEKILLGLTSTYGWLPVVWAFLLPYIMNLLDWVMHLFSIIENSPLRETVFFSYIIVSVIIHVIIFGVLAYRFPKYYILPAWGLNVYSFYLGVQKIVFYLIYLDEPDKFYYFETGEDRFHFFTPRDIYLTVIELFFLIILFRPALFYFQKLTGNFLSWFR